MLLSYSCLRTKWKSRRNGLYPNTGSIKFVPANRKDRIKNTRLPSTLPWRPECVLHFSHATHTDFKENSDQAKSKKKISLFVKIYLQLRQGQMFTLQWWQVDGTRNSLPAIAFSFNFVASFAAGPFPVRRNPSVPLPFNRLFLLRHHSAFSKYLLFSQRIIYSNRNT